MRLRAREIAMGVLFLALLAFVGLLDYLAAATLFPRALALFAAVGVLFAALFLLAGGRRTVLLLTGCYLAAILVLRFAALSPAKPFRAFQRSIEPGMTRAEVLGELHRRFPSSGRFPRPEISSSEAGEMWLVLDRSHGGWNSELVRVAFVDGLTVETSYHPD